jgi:hypothetical protein
VDITIASYNTALEVLSRRYAAAMDQRDREALLSVFHRDATMRVEQPGRKPGLLRGHEELGRLTSIISRWPRTMHFLAQSLYQTCDDTGEGEVYCVAHHFDSVTPGSGGDHVMYIRYEDNYRADESGAWRIAHRTVVVEATDDRPAGTAGQ